MAFRESGILLLSFLFVCSVTVGIAAGVSGAERPVERGPTAQQMGGDAPTGLANQSIKETLEVDSSAFQRVLSGNTVNYRVKRVDGSTQTWGARYDSNGKVDELERGGFDSPDFTARTTETTAKSIADSNSTGTAARKAVSYGLMDVKGNKTSTKALAGTASTLSPQVQGPKTQSGSFDIDDDGSPDVLADIEGKDTDGDGTVDSQVKTVLQDIDDDGEMETVTSDITDINPFVTGVARLDTNDDGVEDTKLTVKAFDTDGDGRFDRRTKTLLTKRESEGNQTTFSESTTDIEPTDQVSVTWDLSGNGIPDVKLDLSARDTDDSGQFDTKSTTIHLNVDGEEGYETSTTSTGKVTPSLSLSIEVDTNNDGTPDTKATFTAEDSDQDGSYDTTTREILKDTDGDGKYDQTVSLVECERGFIQKEVCGGGFSNENDVISVLVAPANISRMGSIASIIGTLVQLARGS